MEGKEITSSLLRDHYVPMTQTPRYLYETERSLLWSRPSARLEEQCSGGPHSATQYRQEAHILKKPLNSEVRESTLSLILSVSGPTQALRSSAHLKSCWLQVYLAELVPSKPSEGHGPKQTPRCALPTCVRALRLLHELPTARPVRTTWVSFVSMATAEVPTCMIQREGNP